MAQTAAAPAGEVQEVVVTGSRLATGFTAPTPVSVMGSAQLEARGATAVADVVQEIPSFRPSGQTQGVSGTFSVGQSLLDLRGLGPTRTLVLVDGRRHVPNNVNGTFDTNMLPTSLVDRTEVVTGGASAAYGSDAVAGVVNFILRDRLEGFRGNLQYGVSGEGDTKETSGSIGYGRSFADGKGHIIIGGDLSKNDPSGFMSSRDWGRKQPGLVPLSARPAGVPAFVIADNAQYYLSPGSLVTSCTRGATVLAGAACPLNNTTFGPGGTPSILQNSGLVGSTLMVGPAGGGGQNYGYNTGSTSLMKVGGERKTFLTRASYDVTPNTTLWGQYSYGRFQVESRGTYFTRNSNTLFVNRDNPYIPAATAAQMDAQGITQLRMNRLNTDFGPVDPRNKNDFTEFSVGARGEVAGWKWDASYINGSAAFTYDIGGLSLLPNYYASLYAVRDAGGNVVCGAAASNPNFAQLTVAQRAAQQPGCVPFNPFGPTSMSKAAYDYVNQRVSQHTDYDRDSASVNFSGEPFMLPAGPVALAVGGEWRKDTVRVTVPSTIEALSIAQAYFAVNPRSGSGEISVKEGYIEVGAPILRDVAFARSLDLNAAVRRTDYSTSGGVTTWKIGGTWDPTDFLRLRVTRSRDIRAPNVPELFVKGNDSFGLRTNPKTGVSAQLNSASLSNPNLDPEKADTLTAGVIFQPTWSFLNGFRASIDYYDIKIDGVIAAVSAVDVLNRYYIQNNQEYAQYITFDNSAIGFARVDSPLLNLNKQKTNGVDIELAYRAQEGMFGVPGRFSANALGTWLDDLETFDVAGVSLGDLAGAIPEWRGTVNLNYDLNRFSANLQARLNSKMTYLITRVGPNDPNYNPVNANSINDNIFPSIAYYSLALRYTVLQDDNHKLDVYGIIDNLFDKDPPGGSWAVLSGLGTGGSGGFNPYDGVGRYFKMGVRFQY